MIAGDPSVGQAFASGDAVNVAARLEQAAPPGEVLVGERTFGLIRDAVEVESVEPLKAKGKAEPLAAYRLLRLREGAPRGIARRLEAPLVGREAELGALDDALATTIERRHAQLVVVAGEAGLGKSRLAAAFTERASQIATVLEGRCPSYGEGALYPLRQALLGLAKIGPADKPEAGREKLRALAGEGDRLVFETLVAFLGLSEQPGDIREAAWAIRRLLDALAAQRPVALLIDDAHWADEALLELAADLAASGERALLVLLLARPELLEDEQRAAALGSPKTIRLGSLGAAAEEQIAREVLGAKPPAELPERLRARAAGNPLYLEELLRSLADAGLVVRENGNLRVSETIDVPDSVEALLTARVESLTALARATLEAAAVAEDSVWVGTVAALQPERSQAGVGAEIETLVERGFLVAVSSALADQRQFRFSHVLMREAAYRLVTKRRRAQLHQRMAAWLEDRAEAGELDFAAAIGRHLAAAHGYQAELGEPEAELAELARRATGHLARGGNAALEQEDDRLAVELLERAGGLAAMPGERAPVLADLGLARFRLGESKDAIEAAEAAIEAAEAAGDAEHQWIARLCRATALVEGDPERHLTKEATEARAAIAALAGTDYDWAHSAWLVLAHNLGDRGDAEAALEAVERAAEHARRSERRRDQVSALSFQIQMYILGPAPVIRLARFGEDCLGRRPELGGSAQLEGHALRGLGFARGEQGRIEEARELFGRSAGIFDQIPASENDARMIGGMVELWAGELDAAERVLRRLCELAEEQGRARILSTAAALLADALARQGRVEEAQAWVEKARENAAAEDIDAQVRWRYAAARARATRDPDHAAGLAAEATELADETDLTPLRADAWLARAEVALAQGRRDEATEAARTAEALYRDKGIVTAAAAAAELAQRAAGAAQVG